MSRISLLVIAALTLACPADSDDGSGDATEGTPEPTSGEPTGGASMSGASMGGEAILCVQAMNAEDCASAISALEFSGCQWYDLYTFSADAGACALTPVPAKGVCVEPQDGDTGCGSGDSCGFGNVYHRVSDDGDVEVVRIGSECSADAPAGGWTHCGAPEEGSDESSGSGDSGGTSTGADAPELDVCACACAELPS